MVEPLPSEPSSSEARRKPRSRPKVSPSPTEGRLFHHPLLCNPTWLRADTAKGQRRVLAGEATRFSRPLIVRATRDEHRTHAGTVLHVPILTDR